MKDKIFWVIVTILICIRIVIYCMYRLDTRLMNEGLRVVFGTWGNDDYQPIQAKALEEVSIKELEVSFEQRKDLGYEKIYHNEELNYDVYTYSGDAKIKLEDGQEYDLKTALAENKVTIEEILHRADFDSEAGKCQKLSYSDGGSTEYCYDFFTILKLDTLEGFNDVVIGHKGKIITEVVNYFRNGKQEGVLKTHE